MFLALLRWMEIAREEKTSARARELFIYAINRQELGLSRSPTLVKEGAKVDRQVPIYVTLYHPIPFTLNVELDSAMREKRK